MTPSLPPLLTVKDVAPLLRISVCTAQRRIRCGTFPIRQVVGEYHPKFTRADVDAFLLEGRATNPLYSLQGASRYFKKGRLARARRERGL